MIFCFSHNFHEADKKFLPQLSIVVQAYRYLEKQNKMHPHKKIDKYWKNHQYILKQTSLMKFKYRFYFYLELFGLHWFA